MSRKSRILLGMFLASILSWVVWAALSPREPVFEGRTLTSWLDHHVASSDARPPYGSPGWKKAGEALRTIGTNAVPTLVKMLRAKDPPGSLIKLMQLARRHGLTRRDYRYAESRHREAEYAFEMLGTNAVSAVPKLIRLYEANISLSSQGYTAQALGHIGRGAQGGVPALIQNFTHTNKTVRFYAVSAVSNIGGDPEIVFPALKTALRDSDLPTRWNALVGFSRFGARARPVVPEILQMLDDDAKLGETSIREQVETTLWRIAPEKVGKPLVVEESTPMVVNGITAEALKVLFDGERKTIIPAGRSIPALAQYYSSDPRPRLTLYRGVSGSEEKDHFLGQFEVLNLRPSANINISTVFVIADGRIILCARDNDQKLFREIRRIENEAVK